MPPGRGVRRRHNSLDASDELHSPTGAAAALQQAVAHAPTTAWALWRVARALLLVGGGLALLLTIQNDSSSAPSSSDPAAPAGVAGVGRIRRRQQQQQQQPAPQAAVAYQAQSLHAPDPKAGQRAPLMRRGLDRVGSSGSGLPGYDQLTDPNWWWGLIGWQPPVTTAGTEAPTTRPTPSPTPAPTPSPTTEAQLMMDYAAYVHEHAVTKREGEYPACAMQRSMDEEGVLCSAGAAWVELTRALPPQLGKGSVAKPPRNPKGTLPERLRDLRPLPSTVPRAVWEREKGTYYWLYRSILNFYGVMRLLENATYVDGIALPPEWGRMKMYRIDREQTQEEQAAAEEEDVAEGPQQESDFSWRAPLVMSFFREADQTALVVVRGTIYDREWQRDFEYDFMPRNVSALFFPPDAAVHAGFFKVFYKLVDPLIHQEVLGLNPRRVIVTGHSLGGSVGELIAYYIALMRPGIKVDMVSFGSPNVGDANYAQGFNAKVNNRHLTFTGVGSLGESYHLGDWISQVPCGHLGPCQLLNTVKQAERESYERHYNGKKGQHHRHHDGVEGVAQQLAQGEGEGGMAAVMAGEGGTGGESEQATTLDELLGFSNATAAVNPQSSYNYTAVGGAVPFTAQDLGHNWEARADIRSYRYSPVGAHVCSYLCWLAPVVGDPEDRCTFTYDWGGTDVPAEYRCPHSM